VERKSGVERGRKLEKRKRAKKSERVKTVCFFNIFNLLLYKYTFYPIS